MAAIWGIKRAGVVLAAALAAPMAQAADEPKPMRLTSGQLTRLLKPIPGKTEMGFLPLGPRAPKMMVIRRSTSGEAEVHDAENDLFIVRSGRATVMVGGKAEGQRSTGPGEWRGGTISGATAFDLGPGDVLWIPVGQPHQTLVPEGGEFNYMVLKTAKAP